MNAVQGTYAPARVVPYDPVSLSSYGPNAIGPWIHSTREVGAASAAKAVIQRIDYIPFFLSASYTVQRVWWANGATVGTDDVQVGVYDQDFNLLLSCTSTLSATANRCQYVSITPVTLPRMRGYLAHWCGGTTATFLMTGFGDRAKPLRYNQASASGLPSTGSPGSAAGFIPVFGITRRASP